jgi:signal transduction histidine kinase
VTPGRRAKWIPDVLLALDEEYAQILALLDRPAATQRMMATVPRLSGVDLAYVGEVSGGDRIVLGYPVNTVTDKVQGLIVPSGVGLGGQVMASRRVMWVPNYCAAPGMTNRFKVEADAEGVKGMIGVPILHNGDLLGVLYGANRQETEYGDRTIRALEELAARLTTAQIVAERARHSAELAVYEERRRLALELHDTVGAMLFTLGAGIRRLSEEPALDVTFRSRLAAIEQQAIEATAALRGSLRVLNAPPGQVALGVAVREHCRAFTDRTGITARLITLSELPALSPSRMTGLADAAREALLNVEKHAEARSVVLSLFTSDGGVTVAVSDDGVGLAGLTPERTGFGLAAISEQLARLGGTLTVASNEDGGVTFQAWVPA